MKKINLFRFFLILSIICIFSIVGSIESYQIKEFIFFSVMSFFMVVISMKISNSMTMKEIKTACGYSFIEKLTGIDFLK